MNFAELQKKIKKQKSIDFKNFEKIIDFLNNSFHSERSFYVSNGFLNGQTETTNDPFTNSGQKLVQEFEFIEHKNFNDYMEIANKVNLDDLLKEIELVQSMKNLSYMLLNRAKEVKPDKNSNFFI